MKTFEQITEEVAAEMKEKIHPVILERYSVAEVKQVVNEAAKRYAKQAAEDALNRAASVIDTQSNGKGIAAFIRTIKIILP